MNCVACGGTGAQVDQKPGSHIDVEPNSTGSISIEFFGRDRYNNSVRSTRQRRICEMWNRTSWSEPRKERSVDGVIYENVFCAVTVDGNPMSCQSLPTECDSYPAYVLQCGVKRPRIQLAPFTICVVPLVRCEWHRNPSVEYTCPTEIVCTRIRPPSSVRVAEIVVLPFEEETDRGWWGISRVSDDKLFRCNALDAEFDSHAVRNRRCSEGRLNVVHMPPGLRHREFERPSRVAFTRRMIRHSCAVKDVPVLRIKRNYVRLLRLNVRRAS